MKKLWFPTLLGLAHGLADGIAGLLLGYLPQTVSLEQVALLVLVYNLLAFGGQPVAGLLADRLQRPRWAALTGLTLLGAALLLAPLNLTGAIMLAGLGSATFHVGGGALALGYTPNRAAGPGLFAAPGVVGLALGGAVAAWYGLVIWPFLPGLLVLMLVLMLLPLPDLPYSDPVEEEPLFAGHDWLMLILLVAIALRSAVWNIFQLIEAGHFAMLIWLGFAAMIGKAGGGILADWLGWRRWAVGVLFIAALLLTFGGEHFIPLSLGIALLQSATPATVALSARFAPRHPATVSGLVFGLAIALGGIPFLAGPLPVLRSPPTILLTGLCAALGLWWATQPRQARQFAAIQNV